MVVQSIYLWKKACQPSRWLVKQVRLEEVDPLSCPTICITMTMALKRADSGGEAPVCERPERSIEIDTTATMASPT